MLYKSWKGLDELGFRKAYGEYNRDAHCTLFYFGQKILYKSNLIVINGGTSIFMHIYENMVVLHTCLSPTGFLCLLSIFLSYHMCVIYMASSFLFFKRTLTILQQLSLDFSFEGAFIWCISKMGSTKIPNSKKDPNHA